MGMMVKPNPCEHTLAKNDRGLYHLQAEHTVPLSSPSQTATVRLRQAHSCEMLAGISQAG